MSFYELVLIEAVFESLLSLSLLILVLISDLGIRNIVKLSCMLSKLVQRIHPFGQ